MNELVKVQPVQRFGSQEVSHNWRWKDRFDRHHLPKDMVTRHLFNTLRMIWNNSVPDRMRVGEVKLYTFRSFYSKVYMRQAVIAIGRELYTRDDLTPRQKSQLNDMESWFTQWRDLDEPALTENKYIGFAGGN